MRKLERLLRVLSLVVAVVLAGQLPFGTAILDAAPSIVDSSQTETLFDESSSDPGLDGLLSDVRGPVRTGTQPVRGLSGQPLCGGRIAYVIPDATGPPLLEI